MTSEIYCKLVIHWAPCIRRNFFYSREIQLHESENERCRWKFTSPTLLIVKARPNAKCTGRCICILTACSPIELYNRGIDTGLSLSFFSSFNISRRISCVEFFSFNILKRVSRQKWRTNDRLIMALTMNQRTAWKLHSVVVVQLLLNLHIHGNGNAFLDRGDVARNTRLIIFLHLFPLSLSLSFLLLLCNDSRGKFLPSFFTLFHSLP